MIQTQVLAPRPMKQAETALELVRDMSMARISTIARSYVLRGPDSIDKANLCLARSSLSASIDEASKNGLTPRDVVVSMLRGALCSSNREHCLCAACQERCMICQDASVDVR